MYPKRTPADVVNEAIRENRPGEYLLYALSLLFAFVGVGTIIYGAVKGKEITSLAGGIGSVLFYPAMKEARKTRKESLAVRLLEAPLSRADTAREAAEMLRDIFDYLMKDAASSPKTIIGRVPARAAGAEEK
jgi:hypothetical protein